MMRYPAFPSQPNSGAPPSSSALGPPDLLPSGHNPHYDVYSMSRGRYLGALGNAPSTPSQPLPSADAGNPRYTSSMEQGLQDYPDELDRLSRMDDVQGNGIFDPNGTHGNIHPDSGIFADREGLPGYIARERFFQPSEVRDINTGQPVMYVPANGFMLDPRTQWTMDELKLYEPGLPRTGGTGVAAQSTVVPDQPAWPVGAADAPDAAPTERQLKTVHMAILAAVAGLSGGLLLGIISK